ncbi:glycoside hydrolase family 32 protein [Aurantibacter crassamenti]|uniref:glycoside hydrolase family 32 protein n=1 Tax=Aurantibacter crassamenti TaxID=1837375 RepID=UPI00193A29BE|nr:glycoside hydrolase family 32 protein [Aurantibacter crassamenti]MBM1105676.1 glycoside hydrolase family 32 protein [Aurantibacter crassamenti]
MKNTLSILIGFITVFCMLVSCKGEPKNSKNVSIVTDSVPNGENEKLYRPNFHFTPKKGWMNDPNGMFYYNGYYHLYYQHYPDGTTWGPMHWGHAISKDLISWVEKPIALYPDDKGYIFSGSAVVDVDNTSGFSEKSKTPVVAMFTYHDMKKEKADKIDVETQAIAYSLDEGLTYEKYEGNPVVKNPDIRDFRDPKVNWDEERKQWTMVLAAGQEIMFYASQDLKEWELISTFGEGIGNHGGVWECPDFFQLPVKDSEETKWVLLVSINPGGPNGGSATQYFVGDFDGKVFTIDQNFKEQQADDHTFWVDHGRDNYAGVTWSNVTTANGGKLFIGWMSNWLYANNVPTDNWRSAMTIARELSLIKSNGTYRLISNPVNELKGYRGKKVADKNIAIEGETILVTSKTVNLTKTEINFEIPDLADGTYTFVLSNDKGDELSFGYEATENSFFVDRNKTGENGFSEKFSDRISKAVRTANSDTLTGKIILDKTSIEIFFDEGETVMTEIFFPKVPFQTLSTWSDIKNFTLDKLEIHEFNFN